MKKIRLYLCYWFVSIFFILLSAFWLHSNDAIIDINVHDTYFVIHNSDVAILLAIIYALFGLFYCIPKFTKVNLNKTLTNIHSVVTLGIIPVYFIGYFVLRTRKHSQFPLFDDTSIFNGFMFIIWLIFLMSQIFLVFNLIISLAKYLITKK